MRFTSFAAAILPITLVVSAVVADEATKAEPAKAIEAVKVETREVKLKDMVLNIPTSWEQQENSSTMRLATYHVPVAEGDSEPGELTVFNFGSGGGSAGDNIDRWIKQFSGEGRTARVTKGKAGDNEYFFADIAGSYNKPVGPPVLRKTELAENYRMLGVILVLEGKGTYFLKLAGPDATIKAQANSLRASFGGDAATEKEYGI